MKNPECDFCREIVGICTECDGCFGEHCQCDPCSHGKTRAEECVFCGRGFTLLIDALPLQDSMADDLAWLTTPDQEMP